MRGNSGTAPLKVLDEDGLATGGKRWRFVPLSERLEKTSARPAALPLTDYDANLKGIAPDDTSFSHFGTTLSAEADTNITATYQAYHDRVRLISLSLPLLYRNRKKVLDETFSALETSTRNGAEATPSLARCLAALSRDLGPQRFYPSFSHVVRVMAKVFDAGNENHHANKDIVLNGDRESIMWDPETSIVPLFATLAEMTKILLQQLLSSPQKTCADLSPLLSSRHQRVREMTAEACLGYLVRKTRESGPLTKLVNALVQTAVTSTVSEAHERHLIDGLGASLFESLRAPKGRLQSRASDVVRNVIQSLGMSGGEINKKVLETEKKVLSVVSRCFRDVAHHLNHQEDTRTLFGLIVVEGELAMRSSNAWRTGSVLFLFRNWVGTVGRPFSGTIGRHGMKWVSRLVCDCFVTFPRSSRVVYEAFSAVLLLAQNSVSDYRQECLCQIRSALELASKHFGQEGLLAALFALLFSPKVDITSLPMSVLLKPLSILYERLAGQCTLDMEVPLLASVLLFRQVRKDANSDLSFAAFKVPSVEKFIKELLSNGSDADHIVKKKEIGAFKDISLKLIAVEYLCYVHVPDVTDVFHKLLDSCESWASPMFPEILTAFAFNFAEEMNGVSNINHCPFDLRQRIQSLVKEALFSGSSLSAFLIRAIDRHVRANPSTMKECFLENQVHIEALFSFLSKGLASPARELRLNSAALLASICSVGNSDCCSFRQSGQNVDDTVARLRFAAKGASVSSLQGLYDSFPLLLTVPESLEGIASNEGILRELVRNVRARDVRGSMVETLIYLSIGLLRTPLKVLWDGAAELWCAMAGIDCDKCMKLVLEFLEECETRLVSKNNNRASIKSCDDNEPAMTENSHTEEDLTHQEPQASCSEMPLGSAQRSRSHTETSALTDSCKQRKQPVPAGEPCIQSNPPEVIGSYICKWKSHDIISLENDRCERQPHKEIQSHDSLDPKTAIVQALKMLCKEPQHTLKYRSELINCFLRFDPRTGNGKGSLQVLTTFTTLLERMGGLKCCESDVQLEERMRERLLSNLTRTYVPLQAATIRCICLSRSPFLKPYRDSFVRLLSEKTFREELTFLTESLFKHHDESVGAAAFSDQKNQICEILTRISFSKITGKQNKLESKRAAVLSFLVAKIPWTIAMPMMTSLALAPIEEAINRIERSEKLALENEDGPLPIPSIQRGILYSIEPLIKHCRRALPERSWRSLGIGTFVLLRFSTRGPMGQSMRSRALHILADMVKARPGDSEFLVAEVLHAIRMSHFNTAENTESTGVPALMYYVDTAMTSASQPCRILILQEHLWAVKYCIQVMKNAGAGFKAVTVSLSVGMGVSETLAQVFAHSAEISFSRSLVTHAADLLNFTCTALREFFSWITEYMTGTRTSQKTWTPVFMKAMSLTSALASLSSFEFNSWYPLADGLCSFLQKGIISMESRSVTLHALKSIITNMSRRNNEIMCPTGNQDIDTIIKRLLPLLNVPEITDDRESIFVLCRIIMESPSPDLSLAGTIIGSMNEFESSKLDELDYDKRIKSLQTINSCLKQALASRDLTADGKVGEILLHYRADRSDHEVVHTCGVYAFSALLYACLSAVRVEDTAVRGTAGYTILLMARWAGSSTVESAISSRTRMFTSLVCTVACSKSLSLRREYCRSLGELVRRATSNSSNLFAIKDASVSEWNAEVMFSMMAGLGNVNDLDADFFENVIHLQPHRRGRALRQLAKHMKEIMSTYSDCTTAGRTGLDTFASRFALPLALNIALERSSGAQPQQRLQLHKHAESREGARRDVSNWAIELVGTACTVLSWGSYKTFLLSLLRRLRREVNKENIGVLHRLLVCMSKAYPRPGDVRSPGAEENSNFLTSKVIPEVLTHVLSSAVEGEVLKPSSSRSSKICRKEKEATTFRAPIAIAAGELMICLPPKHLDTHISLLVTPLSGALRSRMSAPREEAKKAMTSLILILGPKYLKYVLNQVLSVLKNGFRRDACVYVIHAVLMGIHRFCKGTSEQATERKSFAVDDACYPLVEFLAEELKTGLGESDNNYVNPNISSERERQACLRASKVYGCAELLAEHVIFEDTAVVLIRPFLELHKRTTSVKLLNRIRSVLRHLIQGFSRNDSMHAEEAMKMCFVFATWSGVVQEDHMPNGGMDKMSDVTYSDCIGIASVIFGLQLLNVVISRNLQVMNETDENARILQAMCEPFLPLVTGALNIGNDELTHTAFRTCQKLLKLPLRGRAHIADKLSETIVDVLATGSEGVSRFGNSSPGSELFNACLQAGAVLLQEVGPKAFKVVSRERVEALVNISCGCIEYGSVDSRSAALALLRAVVSRKIILPCVYDAMEKVNEIAIHSQSAALQRSCIGLSIRFLVSFPLGSKRVGQNLEFFVRNLNYSSANGRLAALQALETIITKFPSNRLEGESEYLFVALAAAGARDTDAECRECVTECLQGLFRKSASKRQTTELLRIGATLAGVHCSMDALDEDAEYCGAADAVVQRAGLVGLTAAGLSGRVSKTQLQMITRVAVLLLKEMGEEYGWETRYGILRCIEACIGSQHEKERDIEVDKKMWWLWEHTANLLVDQHQWVRISACRLLGCHLSAVDGPQANASEWNRREGSVWSSTVVVRNIMKSLCLELEAQHVSIELAEQALKNLLCMARVLRLHARAGDIGDVRRDVDGDEIGRSVRWLVTRMSGMARRGGSEAEDLLRRACGLRFLIVTGTWWGKWIVQKLGGLYVRPVVQVMESGVVQAYMQRLHDDNEEHASGGAGKEVSMGTVLELGQKLQETLVECMGSEEFYAEYRRLSASRDAIKEKRKRAEAVGAIVDGERAAKKRRAKAVRRREKKRGK